MSLENGYIDLEDALSESDFVSKRLLSLIYFAQKFVKKKKKTNADKFLHFRTASIGQFHSKQWFQNLHCSKNLK